MDFELYMSGLGVEKICDTCKYCLPCGKDDPEFGWCRYYIMKYGHLSVEILRPSSTKVRLDFRDCINHEVD